MSDIFLSYAREDVATAERLAELLQSNGLTVWWDRRLAAGDDIDRVIETALDASKAVVVLWSPHSVESRWVRSEANAAAEANKLVPVRIAECKLPLSFRGIQTPDVFASRDQIDQLATLLTAKLRPGSSRAEEIVLSPESTGKFLSGMVDLLRRPHTNFMDQFNRELEFSRRHPWAYWGLSIVLYIACLAVAMGPMAMEFTEANTVIFAVWLIAYFAYRWYRLSRAK